LISLLLFYFLIFTNFVFDFCVLQVGAPPEMAYLLDEIRLVNDVSKGSNDTVASCLGADPELDEFMVSFSSSNFFCSWRSPNPKKRFPISLSLSLFSSANFLSFHLWWPCFVAYLDMEIKSFLFPGLPILISWFPMKYYFLFFSRFSSSKWSFIFFTLPLFPTDSTWHFSPCRKLTVTFWWSIKRISQGLSMKPLLSWMI